jgi:hypothetical protein
MDLQLQNGQVSVRYSKVNFMAFSMTNADGQNRDEKCCNAGTEQDSG